MTHLGKKARLGDVGSLGAPARLVGDGLGGFEFAEQGVFFGARFNRGQRGRIQPVREQEEIALRGNHHDGEDVIVQGAFEAELERHRRRHRHGRSEHRDWHAGSKHAGYCHHQQHDEQHEGAGAFHDADRMDQDEHPCQSKEQIEHDEAQPPGADFDRGGWLGQKLAAFGDDDGVDHQHRAGPSTSGERFGPQARQEADRADQEQDYQRGGEPVLGEQAQQFVIEGGAGSGGRGQTVARLAHVLGGGAPAFDRRRVGGRAKIALVVGRTHVFLVPDPTDACKSAGKSLRASLRTS